MQNYLIFMGFGDKWPKNLYILWIYTIFLLEITSKSSKYFVILY
jgi:hypothetical protein